MRKFLSAALLLSQLSIIVSCTKEGPQGPAGQDGNANVKSYTVGVEPYQWSGSEGSYRVNINMPAITQAIYDNGDVRVYVKASDAESYQALPYTWPDFSITRYWYQVGSVQLDEKFVSQTMKPEIYSEFKIVVIEGGLQNKNLNFNNYEEVRSYYSLED